MIYSIGLARKQILGLGLHEATFSVRGFATLNTGAQARLEGVAKTVIHGYNAALELGGNPSDIAAATERTRPELRGFLSEGLAMGLYTLSRFRLLGARAFWDFAGQHGGRHEYMSYIGAGLAIGVFGSSYERFMERACPMCGCLVLDGVGFYYAMFRTKRGIRMQYVPPRIARNPFHLERYDNGLGRALWFYASGDAATIAATIAEFDPARQPNIWSGVGLAATYAGGVPEDQIQQLLHFAGPHRAYLGQGSFLAAHTRYRAGNPRPDQRTVQLLTGYPGEACHRRANEIRARLAGRATVDGQPSFRVFLAAIRDWIAPRDPGTEVVCYGTIVQETTPTDPAAADR